MKKFIPAQIKRLLRQILLIGNRRYCSVCDSSFRRFLNAGDPPRPDAQCPRCGALERHRMVWAFLQKKTDLLDGQVKKVLHVAPEPCFEKKLKARIGPGYLTADLSNPRAMVKMDITDIPYADGFFDVIFCSHVLEHVPDDQKAMRELRRVLRRGGWAILMVPITADHTIEDPTITDPQERLRLYGQEDHVRRYGPDYADRLREAGFQVAVFTPLDFLDANEIDKMVVGDRQVFFCE